MFEDKKFEDYISKAREERKNPPKEEPVNEEDTLGVDEETDEGVDFNSDIDSIFNEEEIINEMSGNLDQNLKEKAEAMLKAVTVTDPGDKQAAVNNASNSIKGFLQAATKDGGAIDRGLELIRQASFSAHPAFKILATYLTKAKGGNSDKSLLQKARQEVVSGFSG